MPITKEQALSLYQLTKDSPLKVKLQRYSNIQLLHRLSSKFLEMVAETFLRPKFAIKYHLLPALAQELAFARPQSVKTRTKSMIDSLVRSVALLLETADPTWNELPKSWVLLGTYFDCKFTKAEEYEIAQHELQKIFAETHVDRPMLFLENFCAPLPEMAVWHRFFWLSDENLKELFAEKQTTIKMLRGDDKEGTQQNDY